MTIKKPSLSTEKQQAIINNVLQENKQHSGVILEPITAGQQPPSAATLGAPAAEKKTGLSKVLREVATSSISGIFTYFIIITREKSKCDSFLLNVADSMSLSSPPGTQSPRDFDKLYESSVPKEIQNLSENLQHLLMGRMTQAKTISKTKKIVIYVSAADSQGIHI